MRFSKKKLRNSINLIKFNIIKNSHVSKTPHLASCLSCTDIITYLYFNIMDVGKIKKNAKLHKCEFYLNENRILRID